MTGAVTIEFPENEGQIVEAFFRYLTANPRSEMAATRANAIAFSEDLLIPAWKRREPILFANLHGKIVGATFTTIAGGRYEMRVPMAYGHGTWVEASARGMGIAKLLTTRVHEMLRALQVKLHLGQIHAGNTASERAFSKMGFTQCASVVKYDL